MARWIITDVHGCVKTLKALVENQLKLQKTDTLYMLGDYIDRGPDGKGVLDYLIGLQENGYQVVCLMGNHEDLCLASFICDENRRWFHRKTEPQRMWESVGGKGTLRSFGVRHPRQIPQKYIDWMEACLPYLELEDYIVVHAGINFHAEDPFDDEYSMLWSRGFKVDYKKSHGKKVIHGHIPSELSFIDLVIRENDNYDFIVLDNGVFMTNKAGYGNLVAFNPDTKQLMVQSNLDC